MAVESEDIITNKNNFLLHLTFFHFTIRHLAIKYFYHCLIYT